MSEKNYASISITNSNLSYKLNCKACRTAAVRKEVAAAIIKAIATGDVAKNAEISKENLVVRFGEA